MGDRTALLSLRPRFAEALLDGTKTVEIRRRNARLEPGSICLIYASSPVRALVGAFQVDAVYVASAATLWERFGARTALARSEFDAYLAGSPSPCAIAARSAVRFHEAVPLAELRERQRAFVVPQSYRFVAPEEFPRLTNGQACQLTTLAAPAATGPQLELAA